MANRQEGTEWVALPVTNFEACFGTSFGRKYLPKLPKEVFERSDSGYGVGRYLVKHEYLPLSGACLVRKQMNKGTKTAPPGTVYT